MSIASLVAGNVIYTLFDNGLANCLGLETFRHGTNIVNYIGIIKLGLQPSHAGKAGGVTKHWEPRRHDFFKNILSVVADLKSSNANFYEILPNEFFYGLWARTFCAISGYSLITDNFNMTSEDRIKKVIRVFLSTISLILNVLITPTLKFRFNEIEEKRFTTPVSVMSEWPISREPIERWRIGLLGTVLTGINFNWFARVRARPMKVLTGVAQLTAAVALSTLCVSTIMSNPVTIGYAVAGAILA